MHIGKIYPISLNEKTAYLAGVIIGDGYLADYFKSDNGRSYKVQIDLTDFDFITTIASLTKKIIPTGARIIQKKVPAVNKSTWTFSVSNKSWWHFLTQTLKIPFGKKSRVVSVPDQIIKGSVSIKKAFLAGIFDTDGGLKGNCIGITTASKIMCDGLVSLFSDLGFTCRISSWVIKNYNWRYYAVSLYRRDIDRFLKEIPLRDEGKRQAIFNRFIRGRSGAV